MNVKGKKGEWEYEQKIFHIWSANKPQYAHSWAYADNLEEKKEVFGVICGAVGVLDDTLFLYKCQLNLCLNHKVTRVSWAVLGALFNHNYPEKFMWKSEFGGIEVLEISCDFKCSASFLGLGHPVNWLNLPLTDWPKQFFGTVTDFVDQWNTDYQIFYLCNYAEITFQ